MNQRNSLDSKHSDPQRQQKQTDTKSSLPTKRQSKIDTDKLTDNTESMSVASSKKLLGLSI